MMVYIGIIVVLIVILCLQYRVNHQRGANLKYISKKLANIIDENTGEKLMVFTDDKEIISVLIEINRLIERNQKVLADYSKTEIAMRKMLSNISHDLKTPLTVILGTIETINMGDSIDSSERKVLLSNIENKAKEVLELIRKFFDLARLESGDKEITVTRVNIKEIYLKNLLCFYDILSSKDFEVVIDIPEKNFFCLGNEEALDRVLNNLISNAINYGYEGKFLGVSLRSDEDYVYLTVWDKGKGISSIHKDQIFERMYTLEDSRNKLYQGSGLGLTITKRLVESLGGEILLESKPYERTAFTIKLKRITY